MMSVMFIKIEFCKIDIAFFVKLIQHYCSFATDDDIAIKYFDLVVRQTQAMFKKMPVHSH